MKSYNLPKEVFDRVSKSQRSKINIEWMRAFRKWEVWWFQKAFKPAVKASPAYPTAYYDVLAPYETFRDNLE